MRRILFHRRADSSFVPEENGKQVNLVRKAAESFSRIAFRTG